MRRRTPGARLFEAVCAIALVGLAVAAYRLISIIADLFWPVSP